MDFYRNISVLNVICMKMAFNQISEEIVQGNCTSRRDQPENSMKKKIFTCEELEGRQRNRQSKLINLF